MSSGLKFALCRGCDTPQPMQHLQMTMLGLLMIGGAHAHCLKVCAANLLQVHCSKAGISHLMSIVLGVLQGFVAAVIW